MGQIPTGKFEITDGRTGAMLFSKLAEKRMPQVDEVVAAIEAQSKQ